MVKHESRYSCKSTIYFNLNPETIKENCRFKFHYNKKDITPAVLNGGDEIILGNWPNVKYIICNISNDIPVKIPSHPYVLMNKSILCNCGIEAENHFLLESLAACQDVEPNLTLTVYFTVNSAFINYSDTFPNFTKLLDNLILTNTMAFEQTLPISLNISKFDNTLLDAFSTLNKFIKGYTNCKEIFDFQERHDVMKLNPNNFFFQ